jgi:hypothetical protein
MPSVSSIPVKDGGKSRRRRLGPLGATKATLEPRSSAEPTAMSLRWVETEVSYRRTPHEHSHPEFFYLVEGNIRNQCQTIKCGDRYAAATGSVHTDFEAESPSTYLVIFRI